LLPFDLNKKNRSGKKKMEENGEWEGERGEEKRRGEDFHSFS